MDEQPKQRRIIRKRRKLPRNTSAAGSPRMRSVRVAAAERQERNRPPGIYGAEHEKFYCSIRYVGGTFDYLAVCYTPREAAIAALVRMPRNVKPEHVHPYIFVSLTGFQGSEEIKFSEIDFRTTTIVEIDTIRPVVNQANVKFGAATV